MPKKKLSHEQRAALLEWLAADYDWRLIRDWFAEKEWPAITRATASYYRTTYAIDLDRLRSERLDSALTKGLALKEERIARLAAHADELEKIKWVPDKNGRLWNEAAWRETLGEIAAEMGHRKQAITVEDVTKQSDAELIDDLFRLANSVATKAGAATGGGDTAAEAGDGGETA